MEDLPPIFLNPKALSGRLKRDQIRTLNVIRGRSRHESNAAMNGLSKKIIGTDVGEFLEYIYCCDMTINMGANVIELMMKDTHYRSSFETNTHVGNSGGINGYMTERAKWESDCFLQLYDTVTDFERPKYGALNYLSSKHGAAPSYGNCFIVLHDHVKMRTTISTGDTSVSRCLGVLDHCAHVVNHFTKSELSGINDIIIRGNTNVTTNQYRELQIHGELSLSEDVARIHVPSAHKLIGEKFAAQFGTKLVII